MKFKRVSIGLKQYNDKEKNKFENVREKININIKQHEEIKNDITNNGDKYIDEYGKIRHVLFENDEELIKDLGLIKFFQDKADVNNDNMDKLKSNLIEEEKEDEDEIKGELNNLEFNQKEILDLFMTALVTCHSGIVDEKEFISKKKLIYQASSPDEVAILNFARKYKYIFLGRNDDKKITFKKPKNNKLIEINYQIPISFEYSSERKSMSVIVQNQSNPEEIFLFMKGADNIILKNLDDNNNINKLVMPNLKESLDKYDKSLTELIHEMREQNNKNIIEKEEEGRNLQKKIDQIELERKMEDLQNKRNNVIYNQKMSVIHDIEYENKIYRDEVQDLKKQNEEIKLNTKIKLERYDVLNQLKFASLKKR